MIQGDICVQAGDIAVDHADGDCVLVIGERADGIRHICFDAAGSGPDLGSAGFGQYRKDC